MSAAAFVFPAEELVRLVIVPNDPTAPVPIPTDDQKQAVFAAVAPLCPITTRLRVLRPSFAPLVLDVAIVRRAGSSQNKEALNAGADAALRRFLDPLTGGDDGTGWEFGRSVFRSELYQVIESLDGVDHTSRLLINGDENLDEMPLSPDPQEQALSLVLLLQLTITVLDQ